LSDPDTDASLPDADPASELSSSLATDALFTASLLRMERLIPVLAIVVSVALGVKAGWGVALGFVVGAAVAYVNFRWLKSTVKALADAVTLGGLHASKPSIVLRFLTRFILIAVAAYVIFVSYPVAFHGFLGGLFAPVLAILVEAAYVVYLGVRQGF
jgi:ATP synthase I chain